MPQKISILGCGWLGFALAQKLIGKGYEVSGSCTSPEKSTAVSEGGLKSFVIDIGAIPSNIERFLEVEVLIIAIPSKNLEHFRRLIPFIEASRVQKVLFISSTSVYPNVNGLVTETSPTPSSPLVEIENLFLTNSTFQSTILRFGGLFGYDRKPGNFIRSTKLIQNPEGFINFIHRDDCVEIMAQILKQNVWNEVFNACSDSHPKRRDFYRKEAKKIGLEAIEVQKNAKPQYKIVSSEKLKSRLGFSFKYADLMA